MILDDPKETITNPNNYQKTIIIFNTDGTYYEAPLFSFGLEYQTKQ